MSAFDESLHPRGQAANSGQFREKTNDAPAHELVPIDITPENTRYTLLVDGVPHAVREPGATGITVCGTLEGMPRITQSDLALLAAGAPESTGDNWVIRAEALGPDGNVEACEEVPVPAPGNVLVLEHFGDYMTLSELDERGLTLFDVTAKPDPLITPDTHYPEEPIDLEEVRKALTDSPGDGPSHVELKFPPDNPYIAIVDVHVYEDLLWDDSFTAEELTEHQEIVEAVYREWFGAELDNTTDWESTRVTLTSEIDRHRATKLLILEQTWGQYAKFRNETDPGTYGSPYVGAEIRRRIDEAKVAAAEKAALATV